MEVLIGRLKGRLKFLDKLEYSNSMAPRSLVRTRPELNWDDQRGHGLLSFGNLERCKLSCPSGLWFELTGLFFKSFSLVAAQAAPCSGYERDPNVALDLSGSRFIIDFGKKA